MEEEEEEELLISPPVPEEVLLPCQSVPGSAPPVLAELCERWESWRGLFEVPVACWGVFEWVFGYPGGLAEVLKTLSWRLGLWMIRVTED